jgi:hypothetical protein
MNAEDFYAAYKKALTFLGLSWGEADEATVFVEGQFVVFSANGKEARICLPKREAPCI